MRTARGSEPKKSITKTLALGLAALCSLAILTHADDARADWDFEYAASIDGGWMRQTPGFSTGPLKTSARSLREAGLGPGRSLTLLGLAGDAEVVVDDKWRIPLAGGQLMWAVGSYDETVASLDGSIAREKPWTGFRGDLLLPGFGRRWKHRRWMFGADIRTGVSWTAMNGSVASGAGADALSLTASTFLVQVELEGCRRLDPETRVCLQVVPRLYEHQWLNGVTFGLRMEWGR